MSIPAVIAAAHDWAAVPDAKTRPGGNPVLPFCIFCEQEGKYTPASFIVAGIRKPLALCFRHLGQIQTVLKEEGSK